ncbi:transcriptional regulator [Gordonia sp. NPDC003950]
MSTQSGRRRHRPALLVLAVAAAIACLGLAWWQWDTYESGGGTEQNLGYALQWPAFGFAFVWAYRRFVVLESDPDEARKIAENKAATEIPEGILPERPTIPSASTLQRDRADDDDPSLREYNQYLAELNAADHAHAALRETVPPADTDTSEK